MPIYDFGYMHIPKKYASLINEFNRGHLNSYLFFHRKCAFSTDRVDEKGKVKKVYDVYVTPCEKLLSIKNTEQYLKPGVTIDLLKKTMLATSHLAAAQEMQEAKKKLFDEIKRRMLS